MLKPPAVKLILFGRCLQQVSVMWKASHQHNMKMVAYLTQACILAISLLVLLHRQALVQAQQLANGKGTYKETILSATSGVSPWLS